MRKRMDKPFSVIILAAALFSAVSVQARTTDAVRQRHSEMKNLLIYTPSRRS